MKKGYILKRLLRSVVSVMVIMLIVFVLVYSLIPRDNIFFEDSTYRKLGGKPDDKTDYVYTTWAKLGYLDYVKINDYCLTLYEAGITKYLDEVISPMLENNKEELGVTAQINV